MKKIAVIYKSKYGSTEKYARWIARELNAELLSYDSVKPSTLNDFDLVIFGGGLYAGGINGIKLITKNSCKSLVVFTVGVADPSESDYTKIIESAFNTEQLAKTKVFHLRGGIDYSKLSLVHKGMMALVKKMIEKKSSEELESDDIGILETYGKVVDFCDRDSIEPLLGYVRGL